MRIAKRRLQIGATGWFLAVVCLCGWIGGHRASAATTARLSGSTNICLGSSAVLLVDLDGVPPWSLIWSDGLVESGITNSPALRNVSPAVPTVYELTTVFDAGGAWGSVSGQATVNLSQPPVILSGPASASVCVGSGVSFEVTAQTGIVEPGGKKALTSVAPQADCCGKTGGADGGRVSERVRTWMRQQTGELTIRSNGMIARSIQGQARAKTAPDTILVKPKAQKAHPKAAAGLATMHRKLGGSVRRSFPHLGDLQVVKLAHGTTVEQALEKYRESGLVEYAEPDYQLHALLEPNDPRYLDGTLWHLRNLGDGGGKPSADIRAAQAWDVRSSAEPIVVAVLDTGVWYSHEDLASNMWVNPSVNSPVNGVVYTNDVHGMNTLTGTGDPLDDHFHGTHVAGSIGAVGNNGLGVVGVAWNVRIMACKFLNSEGYGSTSDAIECINYAVSKGAKVLNNSWGGTEYSQALYDAILAARASNVVVVAAAGNSLLDNDYYPTYPAGYAAELDNVVAVAATDANDNFAFFSNYGTDTVGLGAPGVGIYSTLPAELTRAMRGHGLAANYGTLSGTSMASPQVAGAVALVCAHYPEAHYLEVLQRVLNNTDPVPSLNGRTVTGGRLNVYRALTGSPQSQAQVSYQWRKNGIDLPGRTRSVCFIRSANLVDNGAMFDVVVSNACSAVTSAPAVLTVIAPLQVALQPASITQCESNPAALSVSVAGIEPTRYRWCRRDKGWSSPWVLENTGAGTDGMFIGSSTANGDGTGHTTTPDIDKNGVAFGLRACGGRSVSVSRTIEPLLPGENLEVEIDNGYVDEGGSVGFAIYNDINEKFFEFYCASNTYYLFLAGGGEPQPLGIPFTTHGFRLYLDMFPDNVFFLVGYAQDESSSMLLQFEVPFPTLHPVDRIVLYNRNAGASPSHDVYFNGFVCRTGYGEVLVRKDDASDPAYWAGWQEGTDGGTGSIPGATNREYVIDSCAVGDTGTYFAVMNNQCGARATFDASLSVLTGPCSPAEPPHPPRNVTAKEVFIDQIDVSWPAGASINDSFMIERSTDGVHFQQIAQVLPGTTRYRDPAVWAWTTYWYRVRAHSFLGFSDYSEPVCVKRTPPETALVRGWGDNSMGNLDVPAGLFDAVAVVAHDYRSIALKRDGTVVCWGDNSMGQSMPPPELMGVVAVAAGPYHTLALLQNGTVIGWGDNVCGQATPPPGLRNVVAIAAGTAHSVALKNDGTILAWGSNVSGETTPPPGLSGVVAIASGVEASMALRSDGTVVGWGRDFFGGAVPPGLSNVVAITFADQFAVALRNDGSIVEWGAGPGWWPATPVVRVMAGGSSCYGINSAGSVIDLGWGFYSGSVLSRIVTGLKRPGAFSVGMGHMLTLNAAPPASNRPALLSATQIANKKIRLCWTDNSSDETSFVIERALDDGGAPGQWAVVWNAEAGVTNWTDTRVEGLATYWYRVQARWSFGYSLTSDEVKTAVQVPLTTSPSDLAVAVQSPRQIALTWVDTCSGEDGFRIERSTDGSHYTLITLLPPNTTSYQDRLIFADRTYYYRVSAYNGLGRSPLSEVTSITTPTTWNTSVRAWGWNHYRQCRIPGDLTNVVGIAAGATYTCALLGDGTVRSWGVFEGGVAAPEGLSGVVAISSGSKHCLALKEDGTVTAWGDNECGQTNVPTGLADVVAISAGGFSSLAVLRDGSVKAWGDNTFGQCQIPPTLPKVLAVAAGESHSLGLGVDGTVVGWGTNGDYADVGGHLPSVLTNVSAIAAGIKHSLAARGDGSVVRWSVVTPASEESLGAVAVAAGGTHDLMLRHDGTAIARGDNSYGQADVPADLTNVVAITAGYRHSVALVALPAQVAAPSSLVAEPVTYCEVNLSWRDNSANESGFQIDRSLDEGGVPGAWVKVAIVGENVTSLTDRGLSPRTKYWYRLRALSSVEESFFSNQSTTTTLEPPPEEPSGLTARPISTNVIALTWVDNSARETGFIVERAADAGGLPAGWEFVSKTPTDIDWFSEDRLLPGTRYWYRVRAFGPTGESVNCSPTSAVTFSPPVVVMSPTNSMQNAGGVAVFAVKVDGSAPFSYRWLHNGNAVQNDERVSGVTSEVLSIARVLKADEGNYAVVVVGDYGSIVSSNAVLMVVDPVIIEQPKSQEVVIGENAVFRVGAEGTDLHFQWRRSSVGLKGATRSVLNISHARSEDAGAYSVLVSNVFGTVASAEVILKVDVPTSIIEHPRSHTVAAGRNTTLAVVATGSPAPAYEWYFNGVAIPGACDASLNISDFQEGSQGEYYVQVTNAYGGARSATAVLYLDWPVRFLSPVLGVDGLLKARLISPVDSVTVIEASSNLTDWLPLVTNVATSGISEWRGTNHIGSTSRFYRARILP